MTCSRRVLLATAVALMIGSTAWAAEAASVEAIDGGLRVSLGGEAFADYRVEPGGPPILWPVRGPGGHEMTRRFPVAESVLPEREDHPHHRSLWFAHGDVNGHDFWHAFGSDNPGKPRIAHRGFLRREAVGSEAVIQSANDWVAGGRTLLADERTLRFRAEAAAEDRPEARVLDFTIRLTAIAPRVTFGDTKEGTFAVRVPGVMKIDAGLGGGVLNDAGQADAAAWGRPAKWVRYQGPLGVASGDAAPLGGIVLMSAPENPRPRCRWHVRGYGLFAANPFGEKDFPPGGNAQGPVTLARGESLTLRFAAVFYKGEAGPHAVEGWYNSGFRNNPQP